MIGEPFGLVELGSNSLKFYLLQAGGGGKFKLSSHKFPWHLAHDFFSTGGIPETAAGELISKLKAVEDVSGGIPLSRMLAVATGVFREFGDLRPLAARVREATGIRLRVISGEDEAKLMARAFRKEHPIGAYLLFDLGGATTEWAGIYNGKTVACGSLRLGAIRNEYMFGNLKSDPERYLTESVVYCDGELGELPQAQGARLLVTGGTAKAAAHCIGQKKISAEALRGLINLCLQGAVPENLKPERKLVFLPGLVILERILVRTGSTALQYSPASVRDGMAQRLIQILGVYSRDDLHSTLLLETRII